jgi:oligopeptide/dipeptide ABC transporter ATP-binding protein
MIFDDLLRIRCLKTYFHTSAGTVKAVDGVELTVNKKQAVGLVGESGCGKTMTAFSIMRLVPTPPGRIVSGEIQFQGKNLLELSKKEMQAVRGKDISMIFQDPMTYLNPVMKIGDQIAEAILRHQGVSREEARALVLEALQRVRMPNPSDIYEYYPHQLSGGMRQRALIAMALSCKPSLLIADEPTTALDVTVQMQILDLIRDIREELAASLLMITHDFGIVSEICDRVYVMYAGKIVENADILDLYENPKHPYTVGLLGCVLSPTEYKKILPTIGGFVPNLANPPIGCRFQPRCQHAKPICSEKEPPLVETEAGHGVSCWLYT